MTTETTKWLDDCRATPDGRARHILLLGGILSSSQYPPPAAQQDGPVPPTVPSRSNGLAIAGFVLGLLALLGSWIPFVNILAIVLGVVGLVLAIIGLSTSKRKGSGKGLAIAGLVMSLLGILFAIVVNVAVVDAVDDVTNNSVESAPQSSDGGGSDSDDAGGEDAGANDGSVRASPAPLSSEVTGGDWTVSINSVKQIEADSIGARAQSGSILLQVNVEATYNGDDEQGATPWATVKYVTADGNTIDSTGGSTIFLAENEFDSLTTVYSGAVVNGDMILEVPADDWRSGVLAVSPDILSEDTFLSLRK